MRKLAGLWLMMLVLAACNQQVTPTPTSDSPIASGYMPKVIATVILTPTPFGNESTSMAPVSTPFAIPTTTPPPTQTPTPYVGVFLGQPTEVTEDGQIIIPPTIPPFMVLSSGAGSVAIAPGGASPGTVPVVGGGGAPGACNIAVASQFASAYNTNPALQSLGCPRDGGAAITLVAQNFERGRMFWRDTRQIILVTSANTYWRLFDAWSEGMPADDPAFAAPAGLLQPVRGFGLVWRGNEVYRNALGWANVPETVVASFWQEFDGGSLFLGNDGLIYAIPAAESGTFPGAVAP